jgi:hypothetical protein
MQSLLAFLFENLENKSIVQYRISKPAGKPVPDVLNKIEGR